MLYEYTFDELLDYKLPTELLAIVRHCRAELPLQAAEARRILTVVCD